ncbi:TPA: hypothetical protein ACH3X1_007732 [Trebouxia sp. C0004]
MQAWPRSTPACLTLYSPACFFLTSIAFTAGWTAISSLIGYYKALYGPHMLLHMNLAYFLPSLSTLMLQSVWDARVDGKYGIAKAATVRLCLGLGGSALVCAIYPFYETSRTVLLVLVSLLGLCNSVAFSTSYQIVTHFGTSNSVALTTGKQVQLGASLMPESLEWFCMLHGIAAVGIVDPRNALRVTASHASLHRPTTQM